MFTKLKFENFKAFKSIEVSELSRVNIFLGENNCGKSTLLDALFILTGISNPELIMRTNQFRGYTRLKDLSYFFHNFDTEKKIALSAVGEQEGFNRRAFIYLSINDKVALDSIQQLKELSSENKPIYNLSINASIENTSLYSNLTVQFLENEEKGYFAVPVDYTERIASSYFSPSYSFAIIYEMVEEVVKQKQDHIIIDALKKIDSRINDFRLVGTDILVDIGLEKRIPIQLLGDGVRKFFALVVALYSCRDGVLLVDEIDNGLYYSVMKKLWKTLLETAKQFNVQLYVTTHNMDSLQGLEKVLSDNKEFQSDVSLYKLIHRDDDSMRALYYDYESFSTLLQNENDIR